MPTEAEEIALPLDDNQIQEIFRGLNERLNISVDFNSSDLDGLQFWSQLEADLVKSLGLGSMEDIEQGRKRLSPILGEVLEGQKIQLEQTEFDDLLNQLVDHYFGLGIIDGLLREDPIFGIMVNGFQEVYFESRGKLHKSPRSFWSDAHLRHVINRLCAGNAVDLPSDKRPVLSFSLPNNYSVIILLPPATPDSPCLSIRRRIAKKPITIDQLVQFGTISAEMLQFLKASIEARLNILVCGHLGSGANTLVSILSSFIPGDERVISIEYESEYTLRVNHLIKLRADKDPMSENTYGKLLTLAGTMRGDRIVLGEFLPSDTYDILNSVNDDFSGSMLRVTAKSPADAINRLESFLYLDKPTLPAAKIRNLINSSIDLIAYQERLRDGSRVVKSIVEVLDSIDGNAPVKLKEIFGVKQTGFEDGRILRRFVIYGRPSEKIMDKIDAAGIQLPPELFVSEVKQDEEKKMSEAERRAIKFSKGKYAFTSYSKDDRDRVRVLVKELENNGFDIWLDVLDIKPGEEWTKVLESAIKDAGAFLVILTPSAAKSPFVRNEITMAQDEGLPVIPVKMDECDIPIQIRALQYILYDQNDLTATIDLISETLSKHISNKQLVGEI